MKKKIMIIGATLLVVALIIFTIVSYAANQVLYVGLNAAYPNGDGYGIKDPTTGGVALWNLRNYDSTNRANESAEQRTLYCLKGLYGESWEDDSSVIVEYNLSYDLDSERETLLQLLRNNSSSAENDVVIELLDDVNGVYKELLWVIENSYIPGKSDKEQLLEQIGIKYDSDIQMYVYEPTNGYDYSDKVSGWGEYNTTLTDTDIRAVQQAAMWYIVNYKIDGEEKFNNKDALDWLYLTQDDGQSFTPLIEYDRWGGGTGRERYEQANILYNYLIDSAEKNASTYKNGGYSKPVELDLSGINKDNDGNYEANRKGTNYLIGPIKLTKNNDLDYEIILNITNESNQQVSYTITDSNGTVIGKTVKDVANRSEGFYIAVPRTSASEINISATTNYKQKVKKLWLRGTENGSTSITLNAEQPVLDMDEIIEADNISFKAVPKEFDLALRKYITEINDSEIATLGLQSRVPNIEDTLMNGETTANYRHRKDPIVVKTGDKVTYKITIYNEGDKNGYATEITDQLPTGLKYADSSTITTGNNTYNVNYDESTNKIIFTSTTNSALNLYNGSTIDNETLTFECEVTATPDKANDKILTNVAWISRAYDSDSSQEITQVGDDRDSRPQTSPNVTKDGMDNYKGNSSNKNELTDNSYHYKGEQDDDDFEKLKIEPEIEITVTKTWDDNNNQDGLRVGAVTVKLYANGEEVVGKTATLNNGNNWSYTFTGLPLKKDGNNINYSIAETTNIDGYSTEIKGFTITNTHVPETIEIPVKKIWSDNNNQDGIRPSSIDIILKANGVETQRHTLTGTGNEWTHTFTNLPKYYDEGKTIVYTIEEEYKAEDADLENVYDSAQTGDIQTGITITNTYRPEVINIPIKKVWDDENNQDRLRPPEIEVILKADGEEVQRQTITGDTNEWSYTFRNLPKKANGRDIVYTIEEVQVQEYDTNLTGDSTNGFVITNTHIPEVIDIPIKKIWNDNNDQDGIRPEFITITLYANGEPVDGKEIRLEGQGNEWTHVFEDLPKYEDGVEIKYSIEETGLPQGYTPEKSEDGFTITNTHEPEKINIPVKKVWVDNNNQDGLRPEFITITLYADGQPVDGQEIQLKGDNNEWTHTFTDLPKYKDGVEIVYTVEENGVPTGYTSTTSGNVTTGFTITNTYTPGQTSIKVKKVWDDNNNQDGLRPPSVTVNLLKNNTDVVGTVELNDSNNWEHVFTELPEKENGEYIIYSVQEITQIDGYETIITNDNVTSESGEVQSARATEYIITNSREIDQTSITVTKVWEDGGNADNIRPESVTVVLKADGVPVDGQTIELSEANKWTHTFENLPVNKDGKKIEYTVEETPVPTGYTVSIEGNPTEGFVITNTHIPEKYFDLALRKYITKINNNELTTLGLASRVPNIEDTLKNGETTANYRHRKDPIKAEDGDIVTYEIRIFNEGEKAGYASKIIDQLPTGLIYNPSGTITSKDASGQDKNIYTVEYEAASNRVTFEIVNTQETPAKDIVPYADGTLDYETIEIKCKVVYRPVAGEKNILTNVAWIDEAYDSEDGKTITTEVGADRDSEPGTKPNVNKDNMEDYKGNSSNKDDLTDDEYHYKGEQDDDDFEKLYVKIFDLSLRKFITTVNGEKLDISREPIVDVTPLQNGTGTTAIYNHPKTPVALKVGDIVLYTIRVYNEGETAGYASEVTDYLPPYLEYVEDSQINARYGWQISEDGRIVTTTYLSDKEISEFNGTTLDYEDLQIECRISNNAIPDERMTNIAEISEYKYGDTVVPEDIDSESDNIDENIPKDEDLPDYKKDQENDEYVPGNEDDDDFEKVYVKEFDLALRKFITQIQDKEVTTRVPESIIENGNIRYEHPKDPITLHVGDIVIYTIRVYNEGEISGFASEITDDIPEHLEYIPENDTNVEYMWTMYDENDEVTTNVEDAVKIKTNYLSKENGDDNLLQAFDGTTLYYKDIKIAFKVKDPGSNTVIITNHAQISDDSDEDGEDITDKDSTPDEWNEGEDDQDIENVKVEYFDLSLLKFVSKVIIVEDGQEKISETGYNGHEDPEPVVKVELHKKKIEDVVVKFGYGITITNEGDVPGYATEITDYVPEGLKFEASDNPNWTDEGNNVISTKQLENTLLQPGESATVEVILTWINGEDNLALKTNIAEISEDDNEFDVPDKDSTPDNQKDGEDDIDLAKVILAIETGKAKTYFTLTLGLLSVVTVGIILIKKYVI